MKRDETTNGNGCEVGERSEEGGGGEECAGDNGEGAGDEEKEARAENWTRKPSEVSLCVSFAGPQCYLPHSHRNDVWTVDSFWTTPH